MAEFSHVSSGGQRIQVSIRKCRLSLDGLFHGGDHLPQGDTPGGPADLQAGYPQPADRLQQCGGKHHPQQKGDGNRAVRELPDQQDAPRRGSSL